MNSKLRGSLKAYSEMLNVSLLLDTKSTPVQQLHAKTLVKSLVPCLILTYS